MRILKIVMAVAGLFSMSCSSVPSDTLTLVVGTYTSGDSRGIYTYELNLQTGLSRSLSMVESDNPSFLALSSSGDYLYSVSENNTSEDGVSRFEFDKVGGTLTLNESETTQSKAPCYITKGDGWLATANYVGGTISTFPLDQNGAIQQLQQQLNFNTDNTTAPSHLHCLMPSPDGRYLFATDLGKDSIYRFKVNSSQDIAQNNEPILEPLMPAIELERGSGPRHLRFGNSGKYAYLINELSGTVVAFNYGGDGSLIQFQEIAADSLSGGGSADIQLSPDGRFLYASNRLKGDGIAIFSIEAESGVLTKVGYCNTGIHPRNFCITPNGKFLLVACRDSNAVQVYKIDVASGTLEYTGVQGDIKLDKPVFVMAVM